MTAIKNFAAAEARRLNAEMASLRLAKGPICRSCGSEIKVREIRTSSWGVCGGGLELFAPGQPQVISFCPVHGLGFKL